MRQKLFVFLLVFLLCCPLLRLSFVVPKAYADPVDEAASIFDVPSSVLDSCIAVAAKDFDSSSLRTKGKILANIKDRMNNILQNKNLLDVSMAEELDTAYCTYSKIPADARTGSIVVEMLRLIYFAEERIIRNNPVLTESVEHLRQIEDSSYQNPEEDFSAASQKVALTDPSVGGVDVYFQYVDGSPFRIFPYPEVPIPLGFEGWYGVWKFTLYNQTASLIFNSKGPYDYIDMWTGNPLDVTPHEHQFSDVAPGTKVSIWTANLKNIAGNYTSSLGFEIWWDKPWPIANVLLWSGNITLKTDAESPNTSVYALPSQVPGGSNITLRWGGSDRGPAGIWNYDVQYKIDYGSWTNLLTNTTQTSTPFTVSKGHTYYFQCRGKDRFADRSLYSTELSSDFLDELVNQHTEPYPGGNGDTYTMEVRELDNQEIPSQFSLSQNYPNPFNAETQIRFSLPKTAFVTIDVYNMLGQKIRTLVNEQLSFGYKEVTWDGRDQEGKNVASGLYFYKIKAGDFTESKKMILVK